MGKRGLLFLAAALVLSTTACTTTDPGRATEVGGVGTTEQGSDVTSTKKSRPSSSPPSVSIPPRPKELRIDSVDPCTLYTQDQLAQLKVSRSPRPRTGDNEVFKGAKECVFDVNGQGTDTDYDYALILVTNGGIEDWLTGKRNVDATLVSVNGYAAARYYLRGGTQTNAFDCNIAVDVAKGQQLLITMTVLRRGTYSLDQMCDMGAQAAGLAVTTLSR